MYGEAKGDKIFKKYNAKVIDYFTHEQRTLLQQVL